MASLISSGVGSGLDIAGLVAQLVEAEGRPQAVRLDTQEAKAQGKLSALGTLRSALDSFRGTLATLKDIDKFRGRQVTLSEPELVAASATSAATPATYSIEVERLAQSHKLVSATYASKDHVIGTGTLTLATGAEAFSVAIDATNNTLAGIAAAINAAADNTGIAATVVTGTAGARLALTATGTGVERSITVTQSDGDGNLAALVYDGTGPEVDGLEELQAAHDARLWIDGFEVTSPTNSVTGAIEGVDIDLLAASDPGETTTLAVSFDEAAARQTVEQFVKGYNALLDSVATTAGFNVETRTGGPLSGDASVRSIATRVRNELNRAFGGTQGTFELLSQIGVTSDLQGKLSIDPARLDQAFDTDFDGVGALFATADSGLAVRLDAALEPYLASGGVLDTRNAGLKATIEDIADRRTALDERLAAVEQRLLRQFNALDTLLAQLQSTSNFLTQQLSNLPGSRLLDRKE